MPRGLPSLEFPDGGLLWKHAGTVALAAVAVVLIGFSQTTGDARVFAAKHRYEINIDQELFAQAAANASAGLFQGMPVSTSLSASSLNDHSGARTGLASITSGVTVLLTLLALAPLFSDLPKPVLAALIIEAVVTGMMNVPEMRRLARVQRFDFWIALAAIMGTLVFGVLAGVVIGIGLSLLWLISVATHPSMPLLARQPDTQVFRELDEHPDGEQVPGVAVIRMDGGLFSRPPMRWRIGSARSCARPWTSPGSCSTAKGINFVDSQGSAKMAEIVDLTEEASICLRLARLKPAVRATLARDGVLARVGEEKVHRNVYRAVYAQSSAPDEPPQEAAN